MLLENGVAVTALLLLVLLPTVEMLLRTLFRTGLIGQTDHVLHLVLVVGFVGGLITAREGRHLSMAGVGAGLATSTAELFRVVAAFLSTTVCVALAWSAVSFMVIGFGPGQQAGLLPVRLFVVALPVSYAGMALRFSAGPVRRAMQLGVLVAGLLTGTLIGASSIVNMLFMTLDSPPLFLDRVMDLWFAVVPTVALPAVVLLVVSAFMGTPLFVVLAGVASMLFAQADGFLEIIPNEGYTVLTNANIPAIPLFTLTGYILSESKAGERLVRVFRALFAWVPGGMVAAAVLASVFFTSFTGASGVTILALGGLLFYILHTRGSQTERFSIGVLTAGSNIGLLFPPSLVLIIYGTIAQVNVFHLFLGGLLPGALLVLALATVGVVVSIRRNIPSVPFSLREAALAIREAIWELLLPVVIVTSFFTGLTTLVETAALAAVYAMVVEVGIKREITLRSIPAVALKCITIVGGVLVILAAARGLSFYIIDARIPIMLRDWVAARVDSPIVFLLLLNLALLVTGCLMDIFSATLIVAPLVIPLGMLYGIDPVHLGVIFIANLGLGFITPPVGIDLFLSSYRFGKPLTEVYRYVFPLFLLQLSVVLVITYVPFFATFLPRLFGG